MQCVTLNQDYSSLAVSTGSGYQLYSLKNIHKGQVERIHSDGKEKNAHIVERLFNSSLVAIVSSDSPCSMKICHFKKATEICNYGYASNILSVKLNRQRLVVCLQDSYCIHSIRDMKLLQTLITSVNNPQGLFSLSVANDSALIAYPSSEIQGSFSIFDGLQLAATIEVEAHNSSLAAINFNSKGDVIATASIKGTVIRTFSTSSGERLHEFRRGLKRCVTISSLAFSQDSLFLAASSNTETVHIFSLAASKEQPAEGNTWSNYISSAITASAASLIPTQVSSAFTAWRAFATARMSAEGTRTVAGMVNVKGSIYILVVASDALLHIFKLDSESGGECELVKSKRLDVANVDSGEVLEVKLSDSFQTVTAESLVRSDQSVGDASYAYKVKREKRDGPCTSSQQLNEIIDNVQTEEVNEGPGQEQATIKLDDSQEFPAMA